jgi:histidine ammonia-lyase
MTTIVLTPMSAGFSQLEQVYRDGVSPQLDPNCKPAVELAASRIAEAAAGGAAVYGVNTGFGKLASVKVAPEDTAQLQRYIRNNPNAPIVVEIYNNRLRRMKAAR